MKSKSGLHIQRSNIDATNIGLTFRKDDGLISPVGLPLTQAFTPHDLRERFGLAATSE